MPLWEKFKTMLISAVEAQAYTAGIFAPEDFVDEEEDSTKPDDAEEKQ